MRKEDARLRVREGMGERDSEKENQTRLTEERAKGVKVLTS
jgi:hypothetical protein